MKPIRPLLALTLALGLLSGAVGADTDYGTTPPRVLVLLGEWFGDAWFPLEKELARRGWTVQKVGVDTEYRGCYQKDRSVVLRSDLLIRDIHDISRYDCLIIPSGPQFRKFIANPEVLKFVRDAHAAGLVVASFCVGNFVVEAAGFASFANGQASFPAAVTRLGYRLIVGPRGGGPPPGDGFRSAPVKEICDAVMAELEAKSTTLSGPRAAPGVDLGYGPYPVGFALLSTADSSRSFPGLAESVTRDRPVRVYLWYPAREASQDSLKVGDFIRLAADDFRLSGGSGSPAELKDRLPVPLRRGLDEAQLEALRQRSLRAGQGAPIAAGGFPLLVVGQGLYYESPLSQVYLCEYLASQGYVVATCPLLGTRYRLVNLSVPDLETEIRDMEWVIATVRQHPGLQTGALGVIGYDLGGMAGLVLTMRHPEVRAFLSMDAGILSPHFSRLPGSHPDYREDRFTVPWLHLTQARFIPSNRAEPGEGTLFDRKRYGDSWRIGVPTDNHGQFSSYARFGIRQAVPGYWGVVAEDSARLHDAICRLAGTFLHAVLKEDAQSKEIMRTRILADPGPFGPVEFQPGLPAPPPAAALVHRIIEEGAVTACPAIEQQHAADASAPLPEAAELRWLGYHFLRWWGREAEAMTVLELNTELYPASAEAFAALGEACAVAGRRDEAIAALRKALELKPDLPRVAQLLESLAGSPTPKPEVKQ